MDAEQAAQRVADGVVGKSSDRSERRVVTGPDGRRWFVLRTPWVMVVLPDNGRGDSDFEDIEAEEPTEADWAWLADYYPDGTQETL